MKPKYERYLLELTSLPTAAGCEDRVIAWVERWAKRRRQVQLRRDRFGNVLLKHREARSKRPIVLAAHMDHPAFVVTAWDGSEVEAAFRGGVHPSYFQNGRVLLHHPGTEPVPGRITAVQPEDAQQRNQDRDRHVMVRFDGPVVAAPGDVLTWDLPPARIEGGRLYAPACDDLAGVAAAIAAFEEWLAKRRGRGDVRVLLTRAEEVGFVGALAACRSRIIPRDASIIALENSKSYSESPIGGGPIVRVGDRTSTFDPDLTYRISRIAQSLADDDAAYRWQRKLMPGGTCEASAYQAMGYTATCLCLPLGNYHNMNEATGRIDSETISLADFDGLIRLLAETARRLGEPAQSPPLRRRLDELFERRRGLLS